MQPVINLVIIYKFLKKTSISNAILVIFMLLLCNLLSLTKNQNKADAYNYII